MAKGSGNFCGIINLKVWGGGCRTFASWHFLHFFMDCFVFFGYEEVLDGEGSERRTSLRRSVTREDLKRRKIKTAAEDLRG